MLSLNDLSQAIEAYQSGGASIDEFLDWFRAASRSRFGESEQVLDFCQDIEAVISELYYGGITEKQFREDLAAASRPFVLSSVSSPARKVVIGMASPEAIENGTSTEPVRYSLAWAR
jgi:hypothetical protein